MSWKVLIVEDDSRNMKLVRDVLRASGYDVVEATDGREGVDKARREHPDLILMDIHLPLMDGREAARLLRSSDDTRAIPLVALSASCMPEEVVEVVGTGWFDAFIAKPIDLRSFLAKVKELLPS